MNFNIPNLENCSAEERLRAEKILDMCKDKPIKKLDAAYWLKNRKVYKAEVPFETQEDRVVQAREELAQRVKDYLHEHGAKTTGELSLALGANPQAVSAACKTVASINSDAITSPTSGSKTHLWMMPIRPLRYPS